MKRPLLVFVFLVFIISCKSLETAQNGDRSISSDSEARCESSYSKLKEAIDDNNVTKILKLVDELKKTNFFGRLFCSRPIDYALIMATKLEKHEIVSVLLKQDDVDVNYRRHEVEAPPLMIAIKNKDTETSKMLIAHPDINLGILFTGRYAIHFAVLYGHEAIIPVLLDHPKINVKKRDFYGDSPLQIAQKIGNQNIISLIEEKIAELEEL